MGQSKKRKQAFFEKHPICAFCGGSALATTVEHCPPRALFQHKHWPEGFEFPACKKCNHGSSDDDLLVSMLARMDPFSDRGNRDGRLSGLIKNAHSQYPDFFRKMMPSPTEARRMNRSLGLAPRPGQTQQDLGPAKVTSEMHAAVCVFARKLSKAIFYLDNHTVFPNSGCLLLNWFTNSDLLRNGEYPAFDMLAQLGGTAPVLKRGGSFLNDQFAYRLTLSDEKDVFALCARFGNAFGLVVFGSTIVGKLEQSIERLRHETKKDGPFVVLQSLSLN